MRKVLVVVLISLLVAPGRISAQNSSITSCEDCANVGTPLASVNLREAVTREAARLATTLATASPQQPQQNVSVWDRLPKLAKGTRIGLTFTDRTEIRGRLVEARADAVVLEDSVALKGPAQPGGVSLKGPRTFLRSNVSSVKVLGSPYTKWAWIGVGIGAGIAALVYLNRYLCC